jgi:hypothetical protein
MNDHADSQDDTVLALLGANHERDDTAGIREALLTETVGVLRIRRQVRRCGLAAGVLGCYLAGAMTVGIWGPGGDNLPQLSTEQVTKDMQPPATTGSAERHVASAKLSRFEVLRRKADRSLLERDDLVSAIRDYKRAINVASADELVLAAGRDTWLLMALKDAQAKEKKHAHYEQN